MTATADIAAPLCVAVIDGVLAGDHDAISVMRSERWLDWCAVIGWDGHGVRRLTEQRAAAEIEHADELARGRAVVARLVRMVGERRAVELLYHGRQMSDGEIAVLLGRSRPWVMAARHGHGITARPRWHHHTRRQDAARAA